jgi:hypothetical protein
MLKLEITTLVPNSINAKVLINSDNNDNNYYNILYLFLK